MTQDQEHEKLNNTMRGRISEPMLAKAGVVAHHAKPAKPVQRRASTGPSSRASAALERLRQVIKFTTMEERRGAIASLQPRVRSALISFMESTKTRTEALVGRKRRVECSNDDRPCKSVKGGDVRAISSVHGTRYIAQLGLEHLRMYTCGQHSAEVAARHQLVFACFRNAVESAGEKIWHDPTTFCLLFENTTRQHNTSEQDMGLSVFIYMRADQWIDRAQAITSPTLSLVDAVALHARLLRARATSWESLRREWAPLLRLTQKMRARMLSLAEAEEVAEQAHRRHVKRRLVFAVNKVEHALARDDEAGSKGAKKRTRERGMAAAKVAASKRRALRQDKQLRVEKWRWLRRPDLSMAEILRGPPVHLQPLVASRDLA